MKAITVSARFDGKQILLDEPCAISEGARLLVTILPAVGGGESEEGFRRDWEALSTQCLARCYGADEPEYTLDDLKERNPDYEGGDRRD